jgi:hypothetical protein
VPLNVEGCVYCGDPAACWQLTDELGYEALCEECGPVDDPPDLSPYL